VHSDTAIFVPNSRRFGEPEKHSFIHQGESELRILTTTCKIPRPNFRWAKTRIKNLHEVPITLGNISVRQLFTEEEHAIMGALRMHAIDVQTNPPMNSLPEHRNPEEIMYFLRGTGEVLCGNEKYNVRPGSLVYIPEGTVHAIFNTSDKFPLQYFVIEFIEQDKMWTARGYQGEI
jgi:mannose-6-phosphate isomerase-like protein (cupin superfamily)